MTPPVATLTPEDAVQKLKYYQKGTFTVGNRLVAEAERSVQASQERSNALTCGHRACQGWRFVWIRSVCFGELHSLRTAVHYRRRD